MGRAPCCDKANVKRGPWSPDEDATLKNYLHKHGTGGNWISLPQRAGLKRCGKSCRLRWLNYLRPDIKHGAFTEEEDNIIISLYYKMGSRWSVIAANLPGRTDNDVKNHWNTKLKKKLFGASNNNINNINKFNLSALPKIDVPFTYTNIFNNNNNNNNNNDNNNNNNPISIFQDHPSSSTPNNISPSSTPSYIDNNNANHNFNDHSNNNILYVPFPGFSTLLAQCSTSNSPMSLLPNFTTLENSYSTNTTTITTNDLVHDPDYSSSYPLQQLGSVPEKYIMEPPEEVSSASGLEDDPFLAELGFGSIQQVMMNPSCGYGDQEDIKPQGLGQSVAN